MKRNLFKVPFEIEFPNGSKANVTAEGCYGLIEGGNLFIGTIPRPKPGPIDLDDFETTCCYGSGAWSSVSPITS